MSLNNDREQNLKKKKMQLAITAIIVGAIVILGVVFVYLLPYLERTVEKEKGEKQLEQMLDSAAASQAEAADKLRGEVNTELIGIYNLGGTLNYNNAVGAFTRIELKDKLDATVVTASDGIGKKAWWSYTEKDGVEYVSIAVDGMKDENDEYIIKHYWVYGSYLVDPLSVLNGEFTDESALDTTFFMDGGISSMELKLLPDGSASGEFADKNPESENNGVVYSMNGSYNVNGDFIDVTLNTDTQRYLKYRLNPQSEGPVSGIAATFFEKQ